MDVGEEKRGERICTCRRPGRTTGSPLFPATHATETFKSFWRQKERCRPLREPKLDGRRGRQPHTRHLFKKNPPRSPLGLSHPLLPLPSPSPMFVLQSLNHLTTSAAAGRVRECVSGSGRGRERGGSPATDRPRTAYSVVQSNRMRCSTVTHPIVQVAGQPLEVTRTQGSDSFPSLPSPGGCGAV